MSISIGTSGSPSARDTHAAWLRRRDDSGRQLADLFSGAAGVLAGAVSGPLAGAVSGPLAGPLAGSEPVTRRP